MADSYKIIIKKLDEFIRKYYKNMLIKGVLYFLALFFVFLLATLFLEFIGHFNTTLRTIIFYVYIVLNAFIFYRYILTSALKMLKIGSIISEEQAASIIGAHFSEISDKLLNTLQLKKSLEKKNNQFTLLQASIDQRIKLLQPIPFKNAIDLKSNTKYIKYVVFPVIIFVLLIIVHTMKGLAPLLLR